MGKTKKVGTTARFGPRYGSRIRKRVKDIEAPMRQKTKCPKCENKAVKRESVGVWRCHKCGVVF
jgi:large subunit ribosomal protein L37Ae